MALKTYGKTADEIENEGGGLQAAGWFRAIVEDAGPALKKPAEDLQFVFAVTEGPYKGAKVHQYVTRPEYGKDEDASKKLNARLLAFANRLGIWDGVSADPDPQWDEAIGNDVVIQTEPNVYVDPVTKQQKSNYRLTYIGMYPLDHPKIPAEVRKALDLPPARQDVTRPKTAPSKGHSRPAVKKADVSSI